MKNPRTAVLLTLSLLALVGLAFTMRAIQPALPILDNPPGAISDGQFATRPALWTLDALRASGPARGASFEENRGQHDARVRFMARGENFTLHLTGTEAVYVLPMPHDSSAASKQRMYALRMSLAGANHDARIVGEDALVKRVSYFKGRDANKWVTDVPTFERVRSHDVYPGVDHVWYGNDEGTLEYDFEVGPGRDPNVIEVDFSGASKVEIADNGDLWIHVAAGVLKQARPFVYQDHTGSRREVSSSYEMRGRNRVGFRLGQYDARQPLVIDPNLTQLAFSSYLGGSGTDTAVAIAVDAARNVYVTGTTNSTDFPTLTDGFDATYNGGFFDIYVTKLNAAGTTALYSSYLGGSADESAGDIAVDSTGRAYVVGTTQSSNFPRTSGAFDTILSGPNDAFVVQLSASGAALGYSTFLGGSNGVESLPKVVIDGTGSAYVVGVTSSANFPVTVGAFDTTFNGPGGNDGGDLFVAKLNATGTGLMFSTFLGGSGVEDILRFGITLRGTNPIVAGSTNSADFPTTSGTVDTTYNGGTDVFISLLNSTGTALVFSTFLGGSSSDYAKDIVRGADNRLYVAGSTASADFPTTAGAHDAILDGGLDGFIVKLTVDLTELTYSTFVGGDAADSVEALALEPLCVPGLPCSARHRVFITGHTSSIDFPTTADAFDASFNGILDSFVSRLNGTGSDLDYSTLFGSASYELSEDIATDSSGNAYLTGIVNGEPDGDFPIAGDSVFQKTVGGVDDAFVSKLGDLVVSGRILNAAGAPMAGVTVTASQAFSATTQTDAQGFYFFNVTVTGSYRITPNQAGTTFTPLFRQFLNADSNRVADFTGQ